MGSHSVAGVPPVEGSGVETPKTALAWLHKQNLPPQVSKTLILISPPPWTKLCVEGIKRSLSLFLLMIAEYIEDNCVDCLLAIAPDLPTSN
ncbi:MAG: hypothetical protein V7L00_27415 [Nostoc sp.]